VSGQRNLDRNAADRGHALSRNVRSADPNPLLPDLVLKP
jgi:hypothetical protein